MPIVDMPAAEVEVTAEQVSALLEEQWEGWAGQEVTPLAFGWDNFLFRVGEDHVARLPRREMAVPLAENEARWLPSLASGLPLPIPAPVLLGAPGQGYPWPWTLVPRIEGVSAATAGGIAYATCAGQLGSFLRALHRPAPREAPANPYRGVPLLQRDSGTRERIRDLVEDVEWALHIWGLALAAPESSERVWLHGDLHPHNLLISDGILSGVVDFGDVCGGDPATDLAVMWSFLPAERHDRFVAVYGVDDPTLWARAKGWALSLGLAYVANSADNSVMAAVGERMLENLAEDGDP
ncbi:MAG: aminoglycoside phosphotransferase family protein [Actinobacteria bacterium]|nr:aminoglycoside phosphotransferase family protein [Actinomycetota bacterium]